MQEFLGPLKCQGIVHSDLIHLYSFKNKLNQWMYSSCQRINYVGRKTYAALVVGNLDLEKLIKECMC